MPVQKFRSIEEMKATAVPDRGLTLRQRITAILARSSALLPPFERPRGVFKFRSIEEMQAQRDAWEKERAQVGLRRSNLKDVHTAIAQVEGGQGIPQEEARRIALSRFKT